jgi:hypothetical protein
LHQRPLKKDYITLALPSAFFTGVLLLILAATDILQYKHARKPKTEAGKKRVQRAFVEFDSEVMSYTEYCKILLEIPAIKLVYFQFPVGISARWF